MPDLPAPIRAYIDAYNARDVEAMLGCLTESVQFRNISGGEVTAEAAGRQAFAELAQAGVAAFGARHQSVTHAITVGALTLAEIDFTATVAVDLPNGWTMGQQLAFSGASAFRLEGDLIAEITDQS